MPLRTRSTFNAASELTTARPAQSLRRVVAAVLGLLALTPVTTLALELGEASVVSGLGQSLLVEIPYRLAANERLAPSCIGLVPAAQGVAGLPTYSRASRISVTSTHIEIFDDRRVREPLIGLNVDVHCDTAPRFVRSYELFIDPPTEIPQRAARDAAPRIAAKQRDTNAATPDDAATATVTSSPTVSTAPTRVPRIAPSPRARGQAGDSLTQGQTYRVVRGDTLSGIAARVAERPGTIGETAAAIFAANAAAFTRGNPDLIAEGRSITIPVMTPATATPTPLPAVREPELLAAAPAPAPAPATTTTTTVPQSPASADIVEPSAIPVPAATPTPTPPPPPRTSVATDASDQATTGRTSWWLTALLALGAAILLAAPLAFVRRRKQHAAAHAHAPVQKSQPRQPVDPVAGIDVVEGRLPRTPPSNSDVERGTDDGAIAPSLDDVALAIGATDTVDLDVGAPVVMSERVAWFADRVDAAAVTALQQPPQPKTDALERTMTDEQMALTIVELDMLRQDYEAEHTLTQHGSQALRDAVADLKATQAARDAKAEQTATLELPQSRTDTADSAANTQTARIRK